MNSFRLILLLAVSVAATGYADEDPKPSPLDPSADKAPGGGKGAPRPAMREGGRPDWAGKGPGGRPPMPIGGQEFEMLSEEERHRVREALAKAWGHEDVHEAREKMMRANDHLRATIRRVLTEIDPHVVEVLEKIRPPDEYRGPGFGQPLDPRSPNFVKQVAERLGRELQAFSRPDRHEETRQFHQKILSLPPMRDALTKLEKLPPEKREEAVLQVREVYRKVASGERARMRERAASEKGDPSKGGTTPPRPAADKKE